MNIGRIEDLLCVVLDEDFASDCDLLMACIILKKQIERIDGKKENIFVPSVVMRKYRENMQTGKKMEWRDKYRSSDP